MVEIRITVPAVPVAQPRPRAVSMGKSARVHEVTHIKNADGTRKPHPIAAFKATVRLAAQAEYSGPPLDGALKVDCCFLMPRPQSIIWKRRPMPRMPHIVKPDLDNLIKSTLDALTGILFRDDSQVYRGSSEKFYAAGSEQPHVEITISQLEEDE